MTTQPSKLAAFGSMWAAALARLQRAPSRLSGLRPAPSASGSQSRSLPISRYTLGEWLNEQGLTGRGVEVGTANGWYAADLLHQWRGEKLYMVDAWRYLEFWDDPMNAEKEEQARRLLGTFEKVYSFGRHAVMIREMSQDAIALFPDGSLDFVYIDADHSYANVVADIASWAPKVKKGGVLAGHDYLDGLARNGAIYGVKSAVDEWAGARGLTVEVIEERPGHEPSWLVRL